VKKVSLLNVVFAIKIIDQISCECLASLTRLSKTTALNSISLEPLGTGTKLKGNKMAQFTLSRPGRYTGGEEVQPHSILTSTLPGGE
jgi:hypothetical protein